MTVLFLIVTNRCLTLDNGLVVSVQMAHTLYYGFVNLDINFHSCGVIFFYKGLVLFS